MRWNALSTMIAAGAMAVSVAACNRDTLRTENTRTGTSGTAGTVGTAGTAAEGTAMTLTGCLQKGSGFHEYILAPSGGSSAANSSGSVADRQLAQASKSYRLNGDNDQMDKLVGRQVRVMGKLSDRADLPAATSGSDRSADRAQSLDNGDLAKVDVQSITQTADACGAGSNR